MLLCGELLETPAFLQGNDEQRLNVVIEYWRENLSVKLLLDRLAQMAGLSKYHLVRFFTRHTGMHLLQYHMQLRLHQARYLLRRNVYPLDAAIMLGFYDQSHFINAFRKVMGTTPHHYASQVCSGHHKFPVSWHNDIERKIAEDEGQGYVGIFKQPLTKHSAAEATDKAKHACPEHTRYKEPAQKPRCASQAMMTLPGNQRIGHGGEPQNGCRRGHG